MANTNYAKDKKYGMANANSDYNPNSGEGKMHFVGSTEGPRPAKASDTAGVDYGLSEMKALSDSEIKNGEPMVTQNQRPESYQKSFSSKKGKFTCGT